ncbi:hypothetical protein ACTXT7_009621 [Hymenolepis weldensis]
MPLDSAADRFCIATNPLTPGQLNRSIWADFPQLDAERHYHITKKKVDVRQNYLPNLHKKETLQEVPDLLDSKNNIDEGDTILVVYAKEPKGKIETTEVKEITELIQKNFEEKNIRQTKS